MLKRRAIIYGVLIYVALYCVHLLVIPIATRFFEGSETFSFLWILNQVLGFATVGVSGFVAGRMAGERRFLHGFTVGATGTVVTALAALAVSSITGRAPPQLISVFAWLITNGFLSGIAAGVSSNLRSDAAEDDDGRTF